MTDWFDNRPQQVYEDTLVAWGWIRPDGSCAWEPRPPFYWCDLSLDAYDPNHTPLLDALMKPSMVIVSTAPVSLSRWPRFQREKKEWLFPEPDGEGW